MSIPLVAALGAIHVPPTRAHAPVLVTGAAVLLRALDEEGWASWLACGALIGIGLMSKYLMARLPVSPAAHRAVARHRFAGWRG